MNVINKIELLSPAGTLDAGLAAINCGADAVYIGAPKFGARAAAGNSLSDIQKLINYAHKFRANVYVTVNTILYDNELDEVRNLIHELYNLGTDAIIFQDMSLLEMDIPPIPLFASTQTHNYEIEKIKFFDHLGIKRIILARELSLNEIEKIRLATNTELEFFIHGALCVCFSGQCYLSHALTGRSANRGECAQPCRIKYTLTDSKGKIIVKDKHLLSLKDLNLSNHLWDLIKSGISSFKIEGRLKDISYVKNITAYYRQHIDAILEEKNNYQRSSAGKSIFHFIPDPNKTFNRGYTTHFIEDSNEPRANFNTPKSMGEFLGKVNSVGKTGFSITTKHKIINGDGLCFFDENKELTGFSVFKADGNFIFYNEPNKPQKDTEIYRNYDKQFNDDLKKDCSRKVDAKIQITFSDKTLIMQITDEENLTSKMEISNKWEVAQNYENAKSHLIKQFKKSGSTIFNITDVVLSTGNVFFLPVAEVNLYRRKLLELHETNRIKAHPLNINDKPRSEYTFPSKNLSYLGNVTNKLSRQFYEKHNLEIIEDGFELKEEFAEAVLMTCKYCLKEELGMCSKEGKHDFQEPFYLLNNNRKFRLKFNCSECQTSILIP